MNKGIFITATDTGVGKTYVGCLMALEMHRRGVDIGVSKPFGTEGRINTNGNLINPDARALIRFSKTKDSAELVNPVCFRAPLAPSVAAELENKKVDWNKGLKSTREVISKHKFTIVEGCGGILVPVTEKKMVLDLIKQLKIPVVIVSRAGLGTINHTLLTVELLKQNEVPISAIVLNQENPVGDLSMKTNADVIGKETKLPVFGPLKNESCLNLSKINLNKLTIPGPIQSLADHLLSA